VTSDPGADGRFDAEMIERERVQPLNGKRTGQGRYVLYWMQASQRADSNPALEHAIAHAAELGLPVVVGFGLMDDYPEANARHYAFLLEGLRDVKTQLAERGIKLVTRRGRPAEVALELSREAALVVCDRGYLRHQKEWRRRLADAATVRVEQVEGDVVVPVGVVSQKAEFAARTIRPKLQRELLRFVQPLSASTPARDSRRLRVASDFDPSRPRQVLAQLKLDRSIAPVRRLRGGAVEARRHLDEFIASRLAGYGSGRSEPAAFLVSYLSAYLHFGHVSPVEIALAVMRAEVDAVDREAFLEELIVRRELSINYVHHEPRYDQYTGVPRWARETLAEHAGDPRPHRYSRRQLIEAKTHDPHWNAAMREMVHTGYMHNYLRMYWAKKILEWSASPAAAFRTTLALNNAYFLDGRDPNSFAGVAWCFGLHDRPWTERPIFGKVRYMNDRGLERKFDMSAYAAAVDDLVTAEA
jgi:deoxyribodipyrimidine photo-lyase